MMTNTSQNSVKVRVGYKVWSVGGCHCIWSGHRMSLNICERETSYSLIRSSYQNNLFWMIAQRKGNFKSSDRQATHHKSVDPGKYPYTRIVASKGFFCKSWSFIHSGLIHFLILFHKLYNFKSTCWMHKNAYTDNCKSYALQGSLNLMAPNLNFAVIVTAILS